MPEKRISMGTAALRLLIVSGLFPLILFVAAGRWDWGMGWALVAAMVLATLFSRLAAFRVHPDLLDERAGSLQHENTKAWDRRLSPLMALTPLLVLLTAGLDHRFGWTGEIAAIIQVIALGFVILGYGFSTWAMLANRFFSGVVRIQTERGHHVIDSGPYAILRHPGYSGSVLSNLAMPLALGSLWAYLPTLLVMLVTFRRTLLEDLTLQEELPGYLDYTQRVRFRLIPGIW